MTATYRARAASATTRPRVRTLPYPDPDTGELVPTRFRDTAELAKLFGCSRDRVRRKCRRDEWPHIKDPDTGQYLMNDEDIRWVMLSMHHAPGSLEQPIRPRLVAVWDEPDDGEVYR